MPWIHDSVTTELSTTSLAINMPDHQSGDLLVYFATGDITTAIDDPGAGWTNVQDNVGSDHVYRVGYRVASSSSETLTLTTSLSRSKSVITVAIRGEGTLAVESSAERTTNDATIPYDGVSGYSTKVDNTLLLCSCHTDSDTAPNIDLPWTSIDAASSGVCSVGVGYYYQETAGATTTASFWGHLEDNSTSVVLAVSDTGLDRLPPRADPTVSDVDMIHPLINQNLLGATFKASSPLDITTINGYAANFDAMSQYVDSGPNPYTNSLYQTPVPATPANTLLGNQYVFSPTHDFSDGVLFFTTKGVLHTDMARDLGPSSTPGLLILLGSSTANYSAWSCATKDDNSSTKDGRTEIIIEPDQATDTTWTTLGTYNPAATDRIMFMIHNPFGPGTFTHSLLLHAKKIGFCGGSTSLPMDMDDLIWIAQNTAAKNNGMMKTQGQSHTCLIPLQFGGGEPTYISTSQQVFQVPRQSDDSLRIRNSHADSGKDMFRFEPTDHGSGVEDDIRFTDCIFLTTTQHNFVVDGDAGATFSLDGSIIDGFDVTLESNYVYNNLKLDCPTLNINSCELNSCDITITENDGLTANVGTDLNNCTLRTGVMLEDSVGGIFDGLVVPSVSTNLEVVGSPETGHAFETTTTGSTTFDGFTITGFVDNETITFDARLDVNASGNYVEFDSTHGYSTGDAVFYNKDGLTGVMGLTDQTIYYVRSLASDQLAFYTTKAEAESDTSRISLSGASIIEDHYLEPPNTAFFNNSGGEVTISLMNGSDTPSVRNSPGSTTNIVSPVNVLVTAVDSSGTGITGARVLLFAAAGGPLPAEETVTSVSLFGTTGTVFHTAHGLRVGDKFFLKGASVQEFNTVHTITGVPTPDSYTFTITASGAPSGTITSTAVILEGLTSGVSGALQDSSFDYPLFDQPLSGRIRKSSSSPYFKTATFSGTLNSSGFSTEVTMVSDE